MITSAASVSAAFIASSIISAPITFNRFTIVSSIRSKSTSSACSARTSRGIS
jgi:hypothetical protein